MADSTSSVGTAVNVAPADTHHIPATLEHTDEKRMRSIEVPLEPVQSPKSPNLIAPSSFRRSTSLDLDDYFTGPRDMSRHSKWPLFMRMHGSITPKMVMPLVFMGAWATAVTLVSKKVYGLGVDSVLLTILGFVVSLGLSFRSSTAYERYAEGRRYWQTLVNASQSLGRVFWIHAVDRPNRDPREELIRKITAMNLINAFAVSLKHALRFEPYTSYTDIQNLVGHLQTFSRDATAADPAAAAGKKKGFFKECGEYLGVSFATSNPRKTIKRTSQPLGNLPLEILNHIAMTIDAFCAEEQLKIPMLQTLAYQSLASFNEVMTGTERVLNTPLPLAYSIAITQITWVYIVLLPFQLLPLLDWVAIPATIAASYIILGLLLIGQEIENPFGHDVSDLPLDNYCEQVAEDLDIIAAHDKTALTSCFMNSKNVPLYPVSSAPVDIWMQRSEEHLKEAIRSKPKVTFEWKKLKNITAQAAQGDNIV